MIFSEIQHVLGYCTGNFRRVQCYGQAQKVRFFYNFNNPMTKSVNWMSKKVVIFINNNITVKPVRNLITSIFSP
jgi:hypothetical protein